MYTESELVRLIKKGSRDAFAQLYQDYSSKLLSHIYRIIGNKEEAEEVLADVFITIIKKINFYKESEVRGVSFKSWIFRIASNRAIDFLRRKKMEQRNQNKNETISIGETLEEKITLKHELLDITDKINRLPAIQKTAMSLKVIENFSYMEISRVMGVSVAMVKQLLFQARHNLKNELNVEVRAI